MLPVYEFGPFSLSAAEQLLRRDGKLVPLTPKALDALRLLVERGGRVVEKEELLRHVWPDTFVEEGNLSVTIFMLRKALGEGQRGQKYIETVPRRGYLFVAPVRRVNADGAPPQAAQPHATEAPPPSPSDALAVLPFVNETDDPHAEYLSDGITESIISSLARLPQLRVLARSTVFRYKGRAAQPQAVGRELNVRAVLTGRVLQFGNRLIIRTELVDVSDGRQLWGEQFDRPPSDVLAVQEQIARAISARLRLQLSGAQQQLLNKPHTTSSAAYNTYLMGRYHWNKRTLAGLKEGIKYFEEALRLDREFALARAGLADSYALLGAVEYSALPPREAVGRARTYALEALALDDTLAEAHASLAYANIFEWNWPEAEREYLRAIELNPNYPTVRHWYGHYLTALGRQTEAIAELTRAQTLEPLSLPISAGLGWHYYLTRQYEQAIAEYRKTLALEENFYLARFLLAMAYAQVARFDDALAEYRLANEHAGGSPPMIAGAGHVYARLGQAEQARAVIGELAQLAEQRYVSPYYVAVIHTALGDHAEAFAWLHRACDNQSEGLVWAAIDPLLDALRADPRFGDILRRVRLEVY
ncbi:MAG TPA: winged helix-turn-helix domain-containing protein [Pyrinomonadaceae bacterium]